MATREKMAVICIRSDESAIAAKENDRCTEEAVLGRPSEGVTICRSQSKGSSFSSVILRP